MEKSSLDTLITQMEDLKKKMKAEGQALLKVEFKSFFEKHPEAKSIMWTQYTPYFNDGDVCEFNVHEFQLNVDVKKFNEDVQKVADVVINYSDSDSECYTYEGGFDKVLRDIEDTDRNKKYYVHDWQSAKKAGVSLRPLTEQEESIRDDFNDLEAKCLKIPEILETIFGDHVLIKATRKGFEISEYEHE